MKNLKRESLFTMISNHWDDEKVIKVWNERCEKAGNTEDFIYANDDDFLNDNFVTPADAVRSVLNSNINGKYDPMDIYAIINKDDIVFSFDYWNDRNSPIDASELADYVLDNWDSIIEADDADRLEISFVDEFAEAYGVDWELLDDYFDRTEFDFVNGDWKELEKNLRADFGK